MRNQIIVLLLVACSPIAVSAQGNTKNCTDACCKQKTNHQSKEPNLTMTTSNKAARIVACKLTTPELQKRKTEVIASLKTKITSKKELPNGYTYLMPATDSHIDEVIAFIKTERMCCDFFDFNVSVSEQELWLTITGPDGAKAFITDEIGL